MELDQKVYNQLISDIQLDNIELISLSVEHNKRHEYGLAEVDVNFKMSDVVRDGIRVSIPAYFEVKTMVTETKEVLFSITFTYNLLYELPLEKTYEDIYFEKFAEFNAPINVWPYARELVSGLTTRMGFPAFVLPMFKTKVE